MTSLAYNERSDEGVSFSDNDSDLSLKSHIDIGKKKTINKRREILVNNKRKIADFMNRIGTYKHNISINNVELEVKDELHISELDHEYSS